MNFFATPITDEYGEVTWQPTTAGFTALVLIFILLLLIAASVFGGKKKVSVKQLSFSAMAMALGVVTSMIEIIHMPMGGSVTLFSMLFITLIGYWYGLGAGLMTSVAYGVLQLIIDPYILSIPQMLIDYIFAFGALGLSGIFSNAKNGLVKGYIAAVLGRYFFAFLSGWLFFGMYAGDYGFHSAVVYSLAYNGAYLGLEAVITLIVISIPAMRRALTYVKNLAVQ